MPQTRQLAAIMFADIMGYTALMQDDESLAMRLKDKFKNKLEAELRLHGGRLIKFSGDGALCSFSSAFEAVKAAVEIQLHLQEKPTVPVRIGIHQADVVFDETDVYGDGVNIASRLESMAVPGSILVSGKVIDDIKNQKEIQTVSLGKYVLKNVKEPVEIFAISNAGLEVPLNKKLEGKAEKFVDKTAIRKAKKRLVWIFSITAVLAIGAYSFIKPWMKKQFAKNELLPAIEKSINENFTPPTATFDMALEFERYSPADTSLKKWWRNLFTNVTMETIPSGAEVWWKDYDKPGGEWRLAGMTPLKEVRFPRPYLRMEIRKKGYQTIEYAGPGTYWRLGPEIAHLKLDSIGSLPPNMTRIPAGSTDMYIVGLEANGPKTVGEFLIDKYEVSNAQFKTFVDAGGYTNKSFWNYPVYLNGKIIPMESAWPLFVDRTGRQGPADWEAGTFPNGKENYPVTGVSWYEAAVYAAYAHKMLPTVFHFGRVAETSRTEFIVPLSNFNNKSTTAAGEMPGYNTFGIYDLAGNAREWCFNETNGLQTKYILGGGWNDRSYSFNDAYSQQPMDRSITNGFRCIKELPGDTTMLHLTSPISLAFRDYKKEKPVDDKTFIIYLNQFNYDKSPLDAKIEETVEGDSWIAERVSFDAGYNKERMLAYIYLPKNFKGTLQPILFFGGSEDIFSKKFETRFINGIDFIIKSGRALIYPIIKGTNDRHDDLKSDLPDETVFYRDHMVMWRKDLGRTIDYLETRKDMQADKVGFLGWSWGGFIGGIIPAIEKRIKAVVLNVGGMNMNKSLPEVDQINFLPRVKQPVLMVNGKYDMFCPVETSQTPMFNFLGTPKENKKIIIYDAGHLVPRTEFVKETLQWFDKYLGVIK
ncbi:MAG: SUMF1/EgtB/PvdO family nonheme iron enzyme [Chitinophagaceae bacterium]